ncbi:MAG: hypothetical protein IT410_03980 [Candidatus Doudnabacteria bacterium]|nr:hypothetical protein [Candidatus Doudnabacteria bacterium]
MDYELIALTAHLLGFALGLGGATISDVMFLKSVNEKTITQEKFNTLKTLSRVIWIGLIILIVSGATMFTLIYMERGSIPMLASPRWQAKLIMVAVVLINGFVFMKKIFPVLRSAVGQTLSLGLLGKNIWLLAISGTISIVSWYSIFIISILPRTVRPSVFIFLGIYVALIICGSLLANFTLRKKLR